MNEVRLDGGERLPLDYDGVGLVLVRGHQGPEPGPLRQLGGGLWCPVVGAAHHQILCKDRGYNECPFQRRKTSEPSCFGL